MPSESGDNEVPGQAGNEPEAAAGADDVVMKSKATNINFDFDLFIFHHLPLLGE